MIVCNFSAISTIFVSRLTGGRCRLMRINVKSFVMAERILVLTHFILCMVNQFKKLIVRETLE